MNNQREPPKKPPNEQGGGSEQGGESEQGGDSPAHEPDVIPDEDDPLVKYRDRTSNNK